MARNRLTKAVSARISEQELADIEQYIEASSMAIADLIRLGIKQYMDNNPVKQES